MNRNVWRYAAVTAGFIASGPALAAGLKWLATGEPPRWIESRTQRRREARRGQPEPMPQVLHELELARLADEVQRVRSADRPISCFIARNSAATSRPGARSSRISPPSRQ